MKHQELSRQELVAYLEHEVTPSEATALEARLAESASARRRLEELRGIRDALGASLPEVERMDLVASIHDAISRPKRPPGWRHLLGRRTAWLSAGFAIAAAASLVLLVPRLHGLVDPQPATKAVDPDEFRARSAAASPEDADRWVGLQAYRKGAKSPPERLRDRMRSDDGLLFAYTNAGPRPFAYLMIFAVSGNGEVYWFYPEYREPATDPTSTRIRQGQADVELPDLVHQHLSAGRLSIYGLFTRAPLRVSEVERAAAGLKERGKRLPFAESAQRIVDVEVMP